MTDRQEAVAEIRRLALEHDISPAEITAVMADGAADGRQGRLGVLAAVMGYIGGVFLFAGLAAFISLNWEVFAPSARVLVTLGPGVAFFTAAMMIERDGRWPGLATPAYLMAEVLQPTGLLVAMDEYGGGGDWRVAVAVTSAIVCAQAAAGWLVGRNAVLVFAAVLFGTSLVATVFDIAGVGEDLSAIVIGASLVLVAFGIHARNRWQRSVWLVSGSALCYWGTFRVLEDTAIEPVFAVITVLGVYLSVQVRAGLLLGISTLACLLYLGYFTAKHFADSLGWPFVLMLTGGLFIGVGYLALRVHRKYW